MFSSQHSNEFRKARLKLTAIYIFMSFLMLAVFSLAAMNAESQAFSKIQQALSDPVRRPVLTTLLERRINDFEADFRIKLLTFDFILLTLASIASYLLSGRTLRPIQRMLKQQKEFSADASHELRTPLATINMEVEALKRTEKVLPSSALQALDNIQDEVGKMHRLTDGLLSLVRPPEIIPSQRVDLASLAERVVKKMTPLARKRGIKIDYPAGSPLNIPGNEQQTEQLIVILLDNAIKYSLPQTTVRLSLKASGKDAVLEVADEGPGIPKKDLPFIFERFYRGEGQKQKGSGLGLSIAKKIAENHQGKINVDSRAGQGSTFSVYFPRNS